MFGVVAEEKLKHLLSLKSGSKVDVYPLIITVFAVPCSPEEIFNCITKFHSEYLKFTY